MNRGKMTTWGLVIGFVLSLPLVGVAGDNKATKTQHTVGAQNSQGSSAVMPVYQPPRLGAPSSGRRVGGGTRGTNKSIPILSVLAPDHTGLTVQEQPALYWFASTVVTTPVELTLTSEKGVTPLLETRLAPPTKPGVQRIRLADYGVKLALGERYHWSIALVLDPERRSKDIIAMGAIERIQRSGMDPAKLAGVPKADVVFRFAEAGLWYDTVMAISELIETAPTDLNLRKQRAALLDQVGLPEVGAYDIGVQDGKAG
jgi:hypothetical protein